MSGKLSMLLLARAPAARAALRLRSGGRAIASRYAVARRAEGRGDLGTAARAFSGSRTLLHSNSNVPKSPGDVPGGREDDLDHDDHDHDHDHDHDDADDDEEDDMEDVVDIGPMGKEYGGPQRGGKFKEPTRFGDWERKGRCTDF